MNKYYTIEHQNVSLNAHRHNNNYLYFNIADDYPKVAAVTKRLISTHDFCTKPSVNNDQEIDYSHQLFQSIRQVPYSALTVEKQPFGKGVFGKCYSALMSVHIKVCISL